MVDKMGSAMVAYLVSLSVDVKGIQKAAWKGIRWVVSKAVLMGVS